MATQDSPGEAFESVDWDEIDAGGAGGFSGLLVAELAAYLAVAAAFVYDYAVIANDSPTIGSWNVKDVEWLFALVLIMMFFHVVVPLARNRRMTAYYWRQFRKNKVAIVSLVYLVVLFFIGTLGPLVWPGPNATIDFASAYAPPFFLGGDLASTDHFFGTDAQGRHLWHLIVYGMRVSFEIGLIATMLAITIGTVVGAVAAYFGGYVDEVLMRYVDIQQTFPVFILLVLLTYLYGASLLLIILLYGVFSWEGIGRLVRSEALQRREEAYVRAANAAGASRGWVIRRHIIPNVSGTVITAATLAIPTFILGEAALSFLGFGDPSTFSWGRTINAGRSDLDSAWWISTIPGLFLFFTVLAFNFVGDALSDAIDPRR